MRKFLTLKHWHLFLLIVICGAWTSPSPLKEIINGIAIFTFSLWIYAIGTFGQERIAELGLNPMNVKLFKINAFILGLLFLIGLLFFSNIEPVNSDTFEFGDLFILYIFFAIFQTIIFACKTLAKIELRREITFGDYFPNLLLLFFFFIGVWILQPKVNRLFTNNEEVLQ